LRSFLPLSWQALSAQNHRFEAPHLNTRFPVYACPQLAQVGEAHVSQKSE
jgi:hypothetical protein